MSNPNFSMPEQPANPYGIDGRVLVELLDYTNGWMLDPQNVLVEQPANQAELVVALDSFMDELPDGDRLRERLQDNIVDIRSVQQGYGYQIRLHVQAGYEFDISPEEGIAGGKTANWRYFDNRYSDREIIGSDEVAPNLMIEGLLGLTGAVALREYADSSGRVETLHKGMFEGMPVYFKETALPYQPNYPETGYIERTLAALPERNATQFLQMLSQEDIEILERNGIQVQTFGMLGQDPTIMRDRPAVRETLALYQNFGDFL